MSGLVEFPTYEGLYPEGIQTDLPFAGADLSPRNIELLTNLATVIFNKHYHTYDVDKEDMIQDSIIKAIELLSQGKFDPTRSCIKNYLYTGMRNVQGHFVHKFRKKVCLLSEGEGDVSDIMESLNFKNSVEDDTKEFSIIDKTSTYKEWSDTLPSYLQPYKDTKEGIILFGQFYKRKLLMEDYKNHMEVD